ncbi:MAG: O-methyltransferase [Deltaproteobacteria bacterium]|nr:MAG: O-methyltransferase [Deltaproteobacteria bacterium]
MSKMIPDLENYFRGLVPPRDELLLELEKAAFQENIPIVGPVVGELLFIMARVSAVQQILELGTATGYSTIYLARGSEAAQGRVLTLEHEDRMAQRARLNFARAGLDRQIDLRVGEAISLMSSLTGPFDLIFMDIDKEGYLEALAHCQRLLKVGGLLITDNVGFRGALDFNQELFSHPHWRSVQLLSFLPQHAPETDGLSLAVRIK